MKIVIRGIHKVRRAQADGSVKIHYYAWRGGPKMLSKPHTPAFALEHAKLVDTATAARPEEVSTIGTLIDRFTGTDYKPNHDFINLAEKTQKDHRYSFKLIREHFGDVPVILTQKKGMKADIRKWHRSYSDNPRKADKLLMSLSKIFSYAIEDEFIDKNPCKGIEQLYEGSRREIVWVPEQIDLFRRKAHPHLLLPFEIGLNTGQRQADVLSLNWTQYDNPYLLFAQRKSNGKVKLRVLMSDRLQAMIEPLARDTLKICLNSRDRPWTESGFQASWRKELQRLGITGVTYHDLRGTFVTERFREGSSVEQISQISGHSVSDVKSTLEKHYLATDQASSDAVIHRLNQNSYATKL